MKLKARLKLRLRLRDLAAVSAFSAVALSGAVPWAVSAFFGLAFILSWFGQRPFSSQRGWSVLTLLAMAVALFGLAFRGILDLVVAAVSFAALVTAHRLLSESKPNTDNQVLLASLLLIAGAAALSGEVWYALCLFAFGVFACLSLGLAVVEGSFEVEDELPVAPVLKQVSLGVGLALIGGVLFFVFFPRLSWNMAARRSSPGLFGATTGMSDRVRLGGSGDIKTSARVVLKARLQPDPLVEELGRYWVGRRFEAFDGKEWRGTGQPQTPQLDVTLAPLTDGVRQDIELLPAYGARTLVALEAPAYFGGALAIRSAGSAPVALIPVGEEEIHFAENAAAYTYKAISTKVRNLPLPEAQQQALLELPDTLSPQVRELAARIAGPETRPDAVASLLSQWLESNLSYTLELAGDKEDPLAHFLFERKAGHCEHFATALAVMLRTRGIHSRVVGGYFGGQRIQNAYAVRAGDAHAWVEAYVPNKGWLTFDATPAHGRGSQPLALLRRLVDAYEWLEEAWRARVVDYSLSTQVDFVRRLVRGRGGPTPEETKLKALRLPSARHAATALALVLMSWLLQRLWRKKATPTHPATTFRKQLESRLAQLKLKTPEEDLEDAAHRLQRERHVLSAPVEKATRRYLEARFGNRPLSTQEAHALLKPLSKR